MIKRILLVSIHGDPTAKLGTPQSGGQNNYVKQLMNSLNKKGYAVDVLTHWRDPLDSPVEIINSKLRVIRISAGKLKFVTKDETYGLIPRFYEEVKSIVNLNDYDIIHTNYWLSGTLGRKIKEDFNLPWIHTSHSLGSVKGHATGERDHHRIKCEKVIFNEADSIIATTHNEKKTIIEDYQTDTHIEVISIGVDKSFFINPVKNRSTEDYFLYVGRLEETKGIGVLIDAFKYLKTNQLNDIKLVIVGGGSKSNNEFKIPIHLKSKIQDIKDRVIFKGGLSQNELIPLFSNCLATIVPSYYESFGMVAAEAQVIGAPVIASKVGGLQEIVQDAKTGYLFENKDSRELAKLMIKMTYNHYLRKKLSNNAKKDANINFNWDLITEQIIMLYEEMSEQNEKDIYLSN